jgi:OPA family glycerol-3-phosphate transporter-like MFS transporter
MKLLGWALDVHGWSAYFLYMIPFPIVGGVLMYSILHRRSLKKEGAG